MTYCFQELFQNVIKECISIAIFRDTYEEGLCVGGSGGVPLIIQLSKTSTCVDGFKYSLV